MMPQTAMRISECKIKEAILNAEVDIRERAIRYFANSSSMDLTVMPLVIEAVEKFGRTDAYRLVGSARDLPQTDATIGWVIDELNDEQCDKYDSYAYNLSMVLLEADPVLVLPRESAILEARHFQPDLKSPFLERLQMLAWDEATCWLKLEEFCEEGKNKEYTNSVNLAHANRIVEALARSGDGCKEKVEAILEQQVDDFHDHPMKWMEPLAVRLAGEIQLASSVPLLVRKLYDDGGDLLNEECTHALVRIGTPAVIEAVFDAFPNAPSHFQIYGTELLELIHSDFASQKCLQLLRQEKVHRIQMCLAHALLCQFAEEAVEEARTLLVGRGLDFESRGLRNHLVETCIITGQRFPEFDQWRAEEKQERAEHWRRVKELENDPAGLIAFALEKLVGDKLPVAPKPTPLAPPASRQSLMSRSESKQRVGRNDPCPCGSGKKFKNCCLKSSQF